ncbi:MAG: deoxyguanosinetriphosphate triphosphohydrolase [Cyclobacteriaceae bacterium]
MSEKMKWESLLNPYRIDEDKTVEKEGDRLRSEFERDYDRLIFSHPFRRLQDKTQVFPIPEHDFVHNRLTHSLEVSSVGRSLGKSVGAKILERQPSLNKLFTPLDFGSVTAAASLAHDLGNPPFGHSGEESISSFFRSDDVKKLFKPLMNEDQWSDLTNFEGNAQGFRILNDPFDKGVHLTMATLAAFTKYPHSSRLQQKIANRKSQNKYGYFQNEAERFFTVAEATGLIKLNDESWCRHPLVFLVEAADDICYHIIDLEDGCRLGLVAFEKVKSLLAEILAESYKEDKLNKVYGENEKISLLRALCINKLIKEASQVFIDHEDEILMGDFDEDLISRVASRAVLKEINELSVDKLYRSRVVLEKEAGGFEVLENLLHAFSFSVYYKFHQPESFNGKYKSIFRLLPDNLQHYILQDVTFYQRMLYITDYVSGITDRHAVSLFKRIKGISLPVS